MDGHNELPTKETVACHLSVPQPVESATPPTKIATAHDNTNHSYTEEYHESPNDHRSHTKNRKKRQRKRPRSDLLMNEIGEASNTGTGTGTDDVPTETGAVVTRLDIIPQTSTGSNDSTSTPFLRIIYPYPHTFTTFCKARWIGRTILDVYSTEFGSYPGSYYTIAIQQGRIRVSDQIVPIDYKLKAHDALLHTVHRHEPGVAVKYDTAPYVHIVEETADLIAIDKPSTLPVHSCGGYHRNSLMNLLHETYTNQKFYTIHRLDRLTSGLIVIAKNSKVAQEWGQAIQLRDEGCQKIYLARVKGHFGCHLARQVNSSSILPLLRRNDSLSSSSSYGMPQYGEYDNSNADDTISEGQTRRNKYAYGYWITDAITGDNLDSIQNDLQSVQNEHSIDEWLEEVINTKTTTTTVTSCNDSHMDSHRRPFIWFNVACPVRVEQPKIGICAAGRFDDLDDAAYLQTVKPAQTRFGIVKYDSGTDSTIIIVQPMTGRTHQIRIHLQHIQHSIANDPNYGGQLWYGNPKGQQACIEAQHILDECSHSSTTASDMPAKNSVDADDDDVVVSGTNGLVTTDVPATDNEIQNTLQCSTGSSVRTQSESLSDWIQRTCVWCNRMYSTINDTTERHDQSHSDRNKIVERRATLEFLVRSPGLWLHAFQYKVHNTSFRTEIPDWCRF